MKWKRRKTPWPDWILSLFSMTMQKVLECGEGIWNSFSLAHRHGRQAARKGESEVKWTLD